MTPLPTPGFLRDYIESVKALSPADLMVLNRLVDMVPSIEAQEQRVSILEGAVDTLKGTDASLYEWFVELQSAQASLPTYIDDRIAGVVSEQSAINGAQNTSLAKAWDAIRGVSSRVDSLLIPDLRPLESRVVNIESVLGGIVIPDIGPLTARVDEVSSRIDQTVTATAGKLDAFGTRLDGLNTDLTIARYSVHDALNQLHGQSERLTVTNALVEQNREAVGRFEAEVVLPLVERVNALANISQVWTAAEKDEWIGVVGNYSIRLDGLDQQMSWTSAELDRKATATSVSTLDARLMAYVNEVNSRTAPLVTWYNDYAQVGLTVTTYAPRWNDVLGARWNDLADYNQPVGLWAKSVNEQLSLLLGTVGAGGEVDLSSVFARIDALESNQSASTALTAEQVDWMTTWDAFGATRMPPSGASSWQLQWAYNPVNRKIWSVDERLTRLETQNTEFSTQVTTEVSTLQSVTTGLNTRLVSVETEARDALLRGFSLQWDVNDLTQQLATTAATLLSNLNTVIGGGAAGDWWGAPSFEWPLMQKLNKVDALEADNAESENRITGLESATAALNPLTSAVSVLQADVNSLLPWKTPLADATRGLSITADRAIALLQLSAPTTTQFGKLINLTSDGTWRSTPLGAYLLSLGNDITSLWDTVTAGIATPSWWPASEAEFQQTLEARLTPLLPTFGSLGFASGFPKTLSELATSLQTALATNPLTPILAGFASGFPATLAELGARVNDTLEMLKIPSPATLNTSINNLLATIAGKVQEAFNTGFTPIRTFATSVQNVVTQKFTDVQTVFNGLRTKLVDVVDTPLNHIQMTAGALRDTFDKNVPESPVQVFRNALTAANALITSDGDASVGTIVAGFAGAMIGLGVGMVIPGIGTIEGGALGSATAMSLYEGLSSISDGTVRKLLGHLMFMQNALGTLFNDMQSKFGEFQAYFEELRTRFGGFTPTSMLPGLSLPTIPTPTLPALPRLALPALP